MSNQTTFEAPEISIFDVPIDAITTDYDLDSYLDRGNQRNRDIVGKIQEEEFALTKLKSELGSVQDLLDDSSQASYRDENLADIEQIKLDISEQEAKIEGIKNTMTTTQVGTVKNL